MQKLHRTALLIISISLIISGCTRGITKVASTVTKSSVKRTGQAFVLKEMLEQGTRVPAKYKNYTQTNIRPNANGKWEIRQLGGHTKAIDDLAVLDGSLYKDQVFTVRSIDLPNGTQHLDELPKHVPIVIESRSNKFYEYIRPTSLSNNKAALRYQNLNINLSDNFKPNQAIMALEKPVYANKPRFIELTSKTGHRLENVSLPSNIGIEKATKSQFLNDLSGIKHQTITLSGRIKNGNLEGVALDAIKKIAQENRLNLVIVESRQPQSTLQSLVLKNLRMRDPELKASNHVGNFFSQFTNTSKRNKEFVELSVNPNKSSYLALHLKAERPNNPPKIRVGQDVDIDASMEFSFRLHVEAVEVFLEYAVDQAFKEQASNQENQKTQMQNQPHIDNTQE